MSSQKQPQNKPGEWYIKLCMNYGHLTCLSAYLQGRILTIVDASISDPKQNKAVKDVMREAFWSTELKIQKWVQNGGENHTFPFRLERGIPLESNQVLKEG